MRQPEVELVFSRDLPEIFGSIMAPLFARDSCNIFAPEDALCTLGGLLYVRRQRHACFRLSKDDKIRTPAQYSPCDTQHWA